MHISLPPRFEQMKKSVMKIGLRSATKPPKRKGDSKPSKVNLSKRMPENATLHEVRRNKQR